MRKANHGGGPANTGEKYWTQSRINWQRNKFKFLLTSLELRNSPAFTCDLHCKVAFGSRLLGWTGQEPETNSARSTMPPSPRAEEDTMSTNGCVRNET